MTVTALPLMRRSPAKPPPLKCTLAHPDMWFPSFDLETAEGAAYARNLCAGCPMQVECLLKELDRPPFDQHGVYGGTTPGERRQAIGNPDAQRQLLHELATDAAGAAPIGCAA